MRQRCEYCGNWIDDTDAVCPHCNGPNAHMMVSGEGVPKTIEELQAFCKRHNLPLQKMRFFIGENYTEPKAFGIYKDGLDFVVYKNKADGTRAVRYRGKDEAYAVNEIYQKMKSEVAAQKRSLAAKQSAHASKTLKEAEKKRNTTKIVVGGVVVAIMGLLVAGVVALFSMPYAGYYDYDNTTYYYNDSGWYRYDTESESWDRDEDPPDTLVDNHRDYYETYSWDSSVGATDFDDSEWSVGSGSYSYSSSDDDWDDDDWDDDWDDDDWDWDDDDDWDSSVTNWDDDW